MGRRLFALVDQFRTVQPLASSIHSIYRPIARSRRQDSVHFDLNGGRQGLVLEPIEASDDEAEDSSTDDGEDFETTPIDARSAGVIGSSMHEGGATDAAATDPTSATNRASSEYAGSMMQQSRRVTTRSASLATVRVKRRARLAEKLREVFGLSELNEVVAGTFCLSMWLPF